MKIEKMWRRLGLLAILAGLATAARANTADSLEVTITPTAAWSVLVTTTPAGYLNLGLVSLNTSTQTVQPSTITVNSTYAYTGLTLTGSITSPGGTKWSFAANTAAQAQDQLAAWVVFTDTSVQTMPVSASFLGTLPGAGYDVVNAGPTNVGNTGGTCPTVGAVGAYTWASTTAGNKPMECATTTVTDTYGGLSFMWMKFFLPPTTTSVTAQKIQYTLTASGPH